MKKLVALLVFVAVVVGAAGSPLGATTATAIASDGDQAVPVGRVQDLGGDAGFGFLRQDPTLGTATRLWDFSVRDT
jgi:hypothetical protein